MRAIALLAEHRIGAMPVIADGALAGMSFERDVLRVSAVTGIVSTGDLVI